MVRKSTLEEKNKAMADLFLTLMPETFEEIVNHLIKLRDTDKDAFSYVLLKFDENKSMVPPRHTMVDIYRKKYIQNHELNSLLSFMLRRYWDEQDRYQGGYYKCSLPVQQLEEPDEEFLQRYNLVYGQLMSTMLDKLKELNYYETYSGIKKINN